VKATLIWRERSNATRFKALMRYIFVSNVNAAVIDGGAGGGGVSAH
jgi:hypothetical protein